MPRKELSPPDENRRRAERLVPEKSAEKPRIPDYGCDESDQGEPFSDELDGRRSKPKTQKSARQYAMSLVGMKSYTERALREKLRIRGYGCDETDDALEYVRSFGYINDLRLAQNAAEKLAARLYGKRKIFAYLSSKGISGDVIHQLDLSEIDFKESCRTLAERHQAMGKTREQIMRSLANAGFSPSEISHAIGDIG